MWIEDADFQKVSPRFTHGVFVKQRVPNLASKIFLFLVREKNIVVMRLETVKIGAKLKRIESFNTVLLLSQE